MVYETRISHIKHPNSNVAVIYGRVSSYSSVEDGTSLSQQQISGRQLCKAYGWEDRYFEADEGVCGKLYWSREALQRAIEHIEAKRARILVFEWVDRATRDGENGLKICKRVWEAGGAVVMMGMIFDGSPDQNLTLYTLLGLAEFDAGRTVAKFRDGKRRTVEGNNPKYPHKQTVTRVQPPYGFHIPTREDEIRGLFPAALMGRHVAIVGDEEQARKRAIVRAMYERYAIQRKLADLERWLERECIPSPEGNPHWGHSSLIYLLKNTVYINEPIEYKSVSRFDESRRMSKSQGGKGFKHHTYRVETEAETRVALDAPVWYNPETGDWWPFDVPVISPTLWHDVQQKRAADKADEAGQGGGKRRYLCAGLLRCPICGDKGGMMNGASITNTLRSGIKHTHTYYRCGGVLQGSNKYAYCKGKGTGARYKMWQIDETVISIILAAAVRPEIIEAAVAVYEEMAFAGNKVALEQERLMTRNKEILRQMERAQKAIIALPDDADQGEIDSLYTILKDLRDERKTVNAALERLASQTGGAGIPTGKTRNDRIRQALDDVRLVLTAEDVEGKEKNEVLCALVDRIEITKDNIVRVTLQNLSILDDFRIVMEEPMVSESRQTA